MTSESIVSIVRWAITPINSVSKCVTWIIDKITILHKAIGRWNIALYKLLSGRTIYQIMTLIIVFLAIFFAFKYLLNLDNNILFKGMTTYDYDSEKSKAIDPFTLKLIYIVGVSFFSGFLVMVLTNGVRNGVEKYLAGDIRYRFYNHIIIFGYNDIADGVLENLFQKGTTLNIVVVVENKVREVREKIEGKYGTKSNLFVLHGNRTTKIELKSFYPNRAFEIFIIGEDESNSDFKGLDCYNELRHMENFSKWEAYIYLYLQEQSSITLMNNRRYENDAFKDIEDDNHRLKIFNTDERWARRILVDSANKWPKMNLNMRNGKRITMDSDFYVHLIIFGMTGTGEVVATTAAKTCHHPNFITKGIRTKITIIDEDFSKNRGVLHGRYYDFMEMCHYTVQNIKNNKYETLYEHTPKEDLDFLDIEWNFIEAQYDDALLFKELIKYAKDKSSLLSVVVCGNNEPHNVGVALGLPKIFFDEAIPVWLYTRSDTSLRNYLENTRYDNIVTWGMPGSYPTQELWEESAAKHLNVFISKYFERGGELEFVSDKDESEKAWESLSIDNRSATIINAAAAPVFVGSMTDWNYNNNQVRINDKEIEVFAQLEHVRWAVCTLLRGYRPLDRDTENEHFVNGGDFHAIMKNLRKQFYNPYICKYENLRSGYKKDLNRAIIHFYRSIIYKEL